MQRKKKKRKEKTPQQLAAPGAMIKLPTTRNLTVSEWGELAGISASLFAPVGGHTVIGAERASAGLPLCRCPAS